MASETDQEIRLLLEAIYQRFHYDFRRYSMASMRRRVAQACSGLGCGSTGELAERLGREPELLPKLLRYLTVQVSEMFRDAAFFRVLRERVVPILRTYPSLKVWTAGCSSGEEFYSLAIVFREEDLFERTIFYATDINAEALKRAEAGVYALERMAAFSSAYRAAGGRGSLAEHYSAAYGSAVFDRSLIKRAVFSDHCLATDSVFAEVHLVTCRNVLIYFDRELQDRALGLFADSLIRRGFLGLGSRESLMLSAHDAQFQALDAATRWYRRC
ncbi:MAG: CheR family methyltransferase [Polyangia bacterium]